MSTSRREFICAAAYAGTAMGLVSPLRAGSRRGARTDDDEAPASRKLSILILGGTGFLGPATVEVAMARGHTVTLFNRGRTNTDLFPDVQKLRGNRDPKKDDGLKALEGRAWDAVVDTSGYVPRIVSASASLLADSVGQYLFVSSISAIGDVSTPAADESAPVATMDDPTNEEVMQNYGALKALCEQAAEDAMPGRATTVRPGLIVGPRDSTDRFTYWPVRLQRGGEVLAPGHPDDPVQYIDVRDLAAFMIKMLEDRAMGVFNTNGPNTPTNIAELLYGGKAVTGGSATFTWVDADFLEAQGIAAWQQMTVWIPPTGEYAGFHRINSQKAIDAGLTTRPLADTVRATLEYFNGLPEDRRAKLRAGLDAEREAEVLAAWHAR